jgi:hypothetical protein
VDDVRDPLCEERAALESFELESPSTVPIRGLRTGADAAAGNLILEETARKQRTGTSTAHILPVRRALEAVDPQREACKTRTWTRCDRRPQHRVEVDARGPTPL